VNKNNLLAHRSIDQSGSHNFELKEQKSNS